MTWVPFEHEDWVDADLARSDALAELEDNAHDLHTPVANVEHIEDDDCRVGDDTFEQHFHGIVRYEREAS